MRMQSGMKQTLPHPLYQQLGVYRHDVFIERLGWTLKVRDGLELDQFDRDDDTVYVVAQHDDGSISGCARLLPTVGPYLLSEVFPQLLNGLMPPSSPDVWELSRFAAVDLSTKSGQGASAQYSSPVALALLRAAMDCAHQLGAKRLITVSPVGVERLLNRAGIAAHRAGPPMIVNGHALTACWIELEEPE
jgi:acyl homoserine lactone synthase